MVVMDQKKIIEHKIVNSGKSPLVLATELLQERTYNALGVTGYGRHLVGEKLGAKVTSEIKAYALGARRLYPEVRTIIDVGGQDCKVINLDPNGILNAFEMNDRCAAGTGRFLEVMAGILDIAVEEFGQYALKTTEGARINSTCTVFAESEVISLINSGAKSTSIARALHEGIAKRIVQMVSRVGIVEPIMFAGGGGKNKGLVTLVGKSLDAEIWVPDEPQIIGAYGAALAAVGEYRKNNNNKLIK